MIESEINHCSLKNVNFVNKEFSPQLIVNEMSNIPFEVKRIYYLYDIPANKMRGAHAHKDLYQLIFAVSGSFSILLDDGKNKKEYILDSINTGLYVVPGIWRELKYFTEDSVCLVLASDKYKESDYIRDYAEFLKYKSL